MIGRKFTVLSPDGYFALPLSAPKDKKLIVQVVGKRAPKAGEYFISGAKPQAYLAKHDMTTVYWVAIPETEASNQNRAIERSLTLALSQMITTAAKKNPAITRDHTINALKRLTDEIEKL